MQFFYWPVFLLDGEKGKNTLFGQKLREEKT